MYLLAVYSIICYGITNIFVFGSIFEGWRNFWSDHNPNFMGKLFSCPMCLSVWVGFSVSTIFLTYGLSTPMFLYGCMNIPMCVFFDGLFSGGIVWLLHTLQEYFERGNQ